MTRWACERPLDYLATRMVWPGISEDSGLTEGMTTPRCRLEREHELGSVWHGHCSTMGIVKNHHALLHRVVAMVAALGLLLQPLAHVTTATSPQAKPAPATTPPAKPPTTKAPAAKPASAAAATPAAPTDGGWPREYSLASGGGLLLYQPQVSSWAQQRQMVALQRRVVPRHGRRQARARDGQGRGRHAACRSPTGSSASRRCKITEASFPSLPKEQLQEMTEVIDKTMHAGRPRHRARSRAGEARQEHDHSEERRRHQGRPARDLLQQDAGGDRQPRWRADLEPDQGERPQVRGEHELGSVRARTHEDLLPAATTTTG